MSKDLYQSIQPHFPSYQSDTIDSFTPLFIDLLRRTGENVIYTDQPQKRQNMGVGLFYTRTPKDDGRIISVREDD
ncbi:hypothetical protein MCU_01608 [Bartonella elizabethae Re6043vi]|uniref:Uncharacterized protein n=2 Tax=Bartonella elizabethae TaxID=807 RepID=J0ZZ46_BAREL|nr:hypothetical protein [Bartonella elizabethae]EJF82111.1 hypothetical protein MCU_01608 [Bartonella elizabethae Re6043vi]EJF94423.1 hypothetical protein MEE_01374 [Bartonella elizabethae F9251 = ATCC 49927]VEJ41972.1 Uncharacterised protein [Bartonella elizabethae]